jgi:hypothetical protein
MIWKFAREMEPGDKVVTYDSSKREYVLGEVTGDYRHAPQEIPGVEQVRPVRWIGRASRVMKNRSLGSEVLFTHHVPHRLLLLIARSIRRRSVATVLAA